MWGAGCGRRCRSRQQEIQGIMGGIRVMRTKCYVISPNTLKEKTPFKHRDGTWYAVGKGGGWIKLVPKETTDGIVEFHTKRGKLYGRYKRSVQGGIEEQRV
jgi:hypothetical protein